MDSYSTDGEVRELGEYVTRSKRALSARASRRREPLYHLFLSALGRFYEATGQMSRLLSRDRVQFLCLHHVFEDEEAAFRALLRRLSQEHEFISYSDAVYRIWSGDITRPYLALSFDDGLKNCLRAAEIMDEFGAKACFFVCPAMIGETDYRTVKEFCRQRLGMLPVQFLSWDDVATLLKNGHEIGGHTLTHPNLALASQQEIETQVGECFRQLTLRLGSATHFAWPYGRLAYFSPLVARITYQMGFRSCASVERGCHTAAPLHGERSLCLSRDCVLANWPQGNVLALLAGNSRRASGANGQWPVGWLERIQEDETDGSAGALA